MKRVVRSLFLLLIAGGCAIADDQPKSAPETTLTASWRLRAESWQWFDSNAADASYTFGASVLRLGISQRHQTFDWTAEIEQPTLFALPEHAIAPAPQGQLGQGANYFSSNGTHAAGIFPKQVFLRFHNGWLGKNSLTLGRFEFMEGNELAAKNATVATLERDRIAQRLIGNFGFTHVGRSFDGVEFVRDAGSWNITSMAGRTTRGVFQVDGLGELDVDVQYAAATHAIRQGEGQFRVFGMGYHDGRNVVKVDARPATLRAADHANIRIGTLGADVVETHRVHDGTADFVAWGAGQFGAWGVQAHRAAALVVESGYQWDAPAHPWLRAGWFVSSGDGNPSDNRHGTFFQMLPTTRIYARFPFFNLMNNEDAFAEFMLAPNKRLKLRADAHGLWLSSSHDLWYQGGGAYDKTTFGFSGRSSGGSQSLANLYDISVDVNISRHIAMTGYVALAQPHTVVRAIYPGSGLARLAYLEFTYRY